MAAVLAADVVGYSRLMGLDEVGTARTLREHRAVSDALVAKHAGRIVKTTGDGVLLEFPSVVDAVECAVAVQAVMAERNDGVPQDRRMLYRIGINLGDILIEGEDILGDGVNVAARLEGIAEPGGICISSSAYEQVRGKVAVEFADLGEQRLKNIDRPVRVYAAKPKVFLGMVAPLPGPQPESSTPLALPDKPSIAVLPFQNMSGDPEQEYFADGMVEDIITGLSRSKSLFVIARTSSFTYKGKAVDIKQVGSELGVRYVLEGSVRKAGNRVRITGQLIDAATGAHLWADRFDGLLEDIFDLQDRVTSSVIGAISPQLERAEIARAQRKPTESLQAYDYYLRAAASLYRFTREGDIEALKLTKIANGLDPEFAAAYALGARCYIQRKAFGWSTEAAEERIEAGQLARRAIELDKDDDPSVLAMAGQARAFVVGEVEEGAALLSRAITLDPNLAIARIWRGWIHLYLGEVDAAIAQFQVASRLSPLDPRIFIVHNGLAYAHFFAGRNEDASTWAATAVRQQQNYLSSQRILMACHAMSGRIEGAREICARLMQLNPDQRISLIKDRAPFRRVQDIERLAQAFRIAGMPE